MISEAIPRSDDRIFGEGLPAKASARLTTTAGGGGSGGGGGCEHVLVHAGSNAKSSLRVRSSEINPRVDLC